jgi:hypothetical protein
VGAVFLLAGAGLAATTAVALVAVPVETATAVVTVAPFLLAPPLAAAAGLTVTRGDARAAALGGAVGSAVGGYVLGAFAIGTLVVVGGGGAAGLVVPLLVAGVPTAAVGAGSGYLGAGGDEAPDPDGVVETSATPTPEDDVAPATDIEPDPEPGPEPDTAVTTTADGGSDELAGVDVSGFDDPGHGGAATADPSPGEVDIDAWADDDADDEDEEIENLDDLFAKTPDPVADDRD